MVKGLSEYPEYWAPSENQNALFCLYFLLVVFYFAT